LALTRVLLHGEEIELDHVPRSANIPSPWSELSPFPMQIEERQIDERVDHQHPHDREVPMPRASEPTAKCERRRDGLSLEGITAEALTFACKRGIRIEDAEPAGDHQRQGDDIDPVRHADHPVSPLGE